MRSVKRMAKRVAKGSNTEQRAFEAIGYAIPRATTEEAVGNLFDVLQGSKCVAVAATLLSKEKMLKLGSECDNSSWKLAKDWVEWWQRPKQDAITV